MSDYLTKRYLLVPNIDCNSSEVNPFYAIPAQSVENRDIRLSDRLFDTIPKEYIEKICHEIQWLIPNIHFVNVAREVI